MIPTIRRFLSSFLIALFALSATGNSLPVVWCLASGHSSVELKSGAEHCENAIERTHASATAELGNVRSCIDVSLAQVAQSRSDGSPQPAPALVTEIPLAASGEAHPTEPKFAPPPDPLSGFWGSQLRQLRTVFLNI